MRFTVGLWLQYIPLCLETISRQILRFLLDLASCLLYSMRDFWSTESVEPLVVASSDLQLVGVRVGFKRFEARSNMPIRVFDDAEAIFGFPFLQMAGLFGGKSM